MGRDGGNAGSPGCRGSPLGSSWGGFLAFQAGGLLGRAACHLPPPPSFSCKYCFLPILAQFVINSFILMCEWLSIPSTGTTEKDESGERVCPRGLPQLVPARHPSPLLSPVWLFQVPSSPDSSGLAPTSQPSLLLSQPRGDLPPRTSCIPSRGECSLLQLCPLHPSQMPRPAHSQDPAGDQHRGFQERSPRWASVPRGLPLSSLRL